MTKNVEGNYFNLKIARISFLFLFICLSLIFSAWSVSSASLPVSWPDGVIKDASIVSITPFDGKYVMRVKVDTAGNGCWLNNGNDKYILSWGFDSTDQGKDECPQCLGSDRKGTLNHPGENPNVIITGTESYNPCIVNDCDGSGISKYMSFFKDFVVSSIDDAHSLNISVSAPKADCGKEGRGTVKKSFTLKANEIMGKCYKDKDNDGYTSSDSVEAVSCPEYYYPESHFQDINEIDCDDSNPSVHPGALEVLNGLDDNCNGEIDEGLGTITINQVKLDGVPLDENKTLDTTSGMHSISITLSSDKNFSNVKVKADVQTIDDGVVYASSQTGAFDMSSGNSYSKEISLTIPCGLKCEYNLMISADAEGRTFFTQYKINIPQPCDLDLYIDNGYLPGRQCTNESASIRFHTHAISAFPPDSAPTDIFLDGNKIFINQLPFGMSDLDWGLGLGLLEEGLHTLMIITNPNNQLQETNTHNNNFTYSFLVENCSLPADTTPPGAVTGLKAGSKSKTWIYWTWTNPGNSDFSQNIIYIDGFEVARTSNNHYNATGLKSNTYYTITVKTIDYSGNINNSGVSDKQKTDKSISNDGHKDESNLDNNQADEELSLQTAPPVRHTNINDSSSLITLSSAQAKPSLTAWPFYIILLIIAIVLLLLLILIIIAAR
jgi:hypothetical protein